MQKKFNVGDRIVVTNYPNWQIPIGTTGTYVGYGPLYHLVKLDNMDIAYDHDCFNDNEIELYKPETLYQKFYKHVRKNLKLSNVDAIKAWHNSKDWYNWHGKESGFNTFEYYVDSVIAEKTLLAYFIFDETPEGHAYWWKLTHPVSY